MNFQRFYNAAVSVLEEERAARDRTVFHLLILRQESVHQLFIDFKKTYDSVRREVPYNILIEFGIPKQLVRLIKMCLRRVAESG
jgi:hypothetical protein